jgi:hypothetical protein
MAFEAFEPARFAMGDTVRLAERVGLIDMEPRRDLGSTGYVLANPGVEYLALQPESGEPFTLTLEPGSYDVEWFAVDDRDTAEAGTVSAEKGGPLTFEPPLTGGPSVLYLRMA